jgi:two-component system nitrogen regulation response regulator GlnG
VRQLENTSRWLTVMATGHEITLDDLPHDLKEAADNNDQSWQVLLQQNIMQRLKRGDSRILDDITPLVESIALKEALQKTSGRKKDAAELLGWGRNTLTRKLKEFDEKEY